jgi:hypothetical protein
MRSGAKKSRPAEERFAAKLTALQNGKYRL